jgi:hypothetical protein
MGLGLIENLIGHPQQVFAVLAMFRVDSYTYGDGDPADTADMTT